uniref:Uncharacterized protein n=1 Tax=Anguilla anguilla TaxID=7936 RepID=A0A0E9WNJ0_ANGAN
MHNGRQSTPLNRSLAWRHQAPRTNTGLRFLRRHQRDRAGNGIATKDNHLKGCILATGHIFTSDFFVQKKQTLDTETLTQRHKDLGELPFDSSKYQQNKQTSSRDKNNTTFNAEATLQSSQTATQVRDQRCW